MNAYSLNPLVAGTLSTVFPGLGQLYVRHWKKAAVCIVLSVALLVTQYVTGLMGIMQIMVAEGPYGGGCVFLCDWPVFVSLLVLVTPLIVYSGLVIWSILDAVRAAKASRA